MKIASFRLPGESDAAPVRLGVVRGEELHECVLPWPATGLGEALARDPELSDFRTIDERAALGRPERAPRAIADVRLLPAVTDARAFLDFYTFEAHVKTCRARRGLEMIPEWYRYPVYYNGNPGSFLAHGETVRFPAGDAGTDPEFDFELELAAVLGREVRNATRENGAAAIAGFAILNDWSARAIQRETMKVGLGPCKGKDFGTSLGPWFVTADEVGDEKSLAMRAFVNGELWSSGMSGEAHYGWGEMIAFASAARTLRPGDVLGSGTVGTGCGLELGRFLKAGDVVALEIDRLGRLENAVGIEGEA